MIKVIAHPILKIPDSEQHVFQFEGKNIIGEKGRTLAAALHQAGFPVHSHSLKNRNRSLECGIGKCGACEMLVDGVIRRICITPVDGVKEVQEISKNYQPTQVISSQGKGNKVYRTKVAIIGAGPAGLACRSLLNEHGVDNLVLDNNAEIGGQFLMQTHQFFFFEKEKKYGGMRGFDIAKTLAGESQEGIFLNSTVWDLLEGKRIAVKNIKSEEIFYVDADYLVIATGAVPFMPAFENDDVPGVYTAAVVQKMMNQEFTLLGKNVLTVGAGNIGYLTSYQLMQAGAKVKAVLEAQPHEGGFPVQANRVRRLGIPILLSHILIKAIPNEDRTGITGAVIAECKDFKAIPGTEKTIEGIDAINICTGLVPDDQLFIKGKEVFGRNVFAAGDALRIGEGTSAVLKGQQVAYEILEDCSVRYNYDQYLAVSKEYMDSQQHPLKIIDQPYAPSEPRKYQKPFVSIDCLHGFACNPCEFSCKHGAITKTSTSTVPQIDFEKCIGCMDCVYQCPGLAIFGYNLKKDQVFLPVEFDVEANQDVYLVDNQGDILGKGFIEKIFRKENKTHVARIRAIEMSQQDVQKVKAFILLKDYPSPLTFGSISDSPEEEQYICHCDDVSLKEILFNIGERNFISVDEVKHTTRLGMGACRGKRCIGRLKQVLKPHGISLVGEATPRGPLSNQVNMGELMPGKSPDQIIISPAIKVEKIKVPCLIAGGGIGGSALFRYLAEAGMKPVMINYGRGASWRNIAGGRPNFSVPELSDIARNNLLIFRELQKIRNIDFLPINYVTFAHDEATRKALDQSRQWSNAYLVEAADFPKYVSPFINPSLAGMYSHALITDDCWQASPGKTVDVIRQLGIQAGGMVWEDCQLIDVQRQGDIYTLLVKKHDNGYCEVETPVFINALGPEGAVFAKKLGIETGIYPVRHQAFITRRLPNLGIENRPLPMLIDRRNYKGFAAVYGQQLAETGQIIGCASPAVDAAETAQNLKVNSREFLEIVSEVFVNWIPELSSVGFQAVWSGYYVEPRMIIDPAAGLFIGLRGQGFMLGQYLAKMYVDSLTGKSVPAYFRELSFSGDGLKEKAFK
jgi:glycine/D-amino acid oxidase-like deaminating enzyme/NADPH-dependent 2,4-dienoyl-CoA reductase/sulfur reductase-like enzyme/Fe-S-cluster-containing hydrogenase component 2/bacterioferritin-associated ferredoxin